MNTAQPEKTNQSYDFGLSIVMPRNNGSQAGVDALRKSLIRGNELVKNVKK